MNAIPVEALANVKCNKALKYIKLLKLIANIDSRKLGRSYSYVKFISQFTTISAFKTSELHYL